jgi:hypothetical protein
VSLPPGKEGEAEQGEVEETDRMMSDGTSAAAHSTFARLPATLPAILRRRTELSVR